MCREAWEFDSPLPHRVTAIEETIRKQKVDQAKRLMLTQLANGEMTRQELERLARTNNHTHYAYATALKELVELGQIESVQAPGAGNRKSFRVKPHP